MIQRPIWQQVLLSDWQRRLSVVMVGILLLQYVRWIDEEGNLWLAETLLIAKWTLLLTCVLELLPRFRPSYRLLLQFVVVFVFNAMAVGYRPVGGSLKTLQGAADLIFNNAGQMSPYIWFSLSVWLIYAYLNWAVERKWRIAAILGVSVAFFAMRDSFSLLELWDQTAWVVFSGLVLLVVRHFSDVKKKNPVGWGYLAEYPATAAVPVVLLLSVVMALGILAPSIPPTVSDPYTLYKVWRGESIPAFGKGQGVFGSGVSANSSSGYSRNDQNLGGGFDFNFDPVMTVDTTHRSYWRGESRSVYDGSGWEASAGDKQAGSAVASEADLARDPRLANSKLKTVEVKQIVTMEKPEISYPVLFGAYSISKLQSMDGDSGSFDRLSWSSRQAELRFQERGRSAYPKTYTVISQMPVIDEAGLRTAPQQVPAGFEEYLQLPSSLPQRVRDLAQQITAGAANPYDKVKLLEQYLQNSYTYTNKPDTDKGKSKDFVDRFLFEIKEGYCDYFSTAMAVLTRSIGIPARWVKGYSSGQSSVDGIDELELLQQGVDPDPDGAGVYTVRNSDAHSWVEVYFAGWGWLPFEATSGFAMPTAVQEAEPETLPELPAIELPADSASEQPMILSPGFVWTSGVTLVLLAVAAIAVVLGFRQGWFALRWRTPAANTFNQRIVAEYNRLLRYSRRRGYTDFAHETARETLGRWTQKDAWLSKDYNAIVSLFEKAKYSGRSVTEGDLDQMSRLVKKLREEM